MVRGTIESVQINLNNCFPEGKDGKRNPLPKQLAFFNAVMDKNGAKFIAFVSGQGAGKSVIGCVSIVSNAVMYGGDYLIGRQFMPELRSTTMRTFFEVCPKELIIEHRVAENLVYIKSATGKPAVVMFKQLEEPDKLRSLNLSGVYIDEANQVSEEAFDILIGRLRNMKGLRKIWITTNPKGFDWIYSRWVKQMGYTDDDKKLYFLVKATTLDNTHLPEEYVRTMLATYSADRIKRDIYGEFESFQGQVYSEFSRKIHILAPFDIPKEWERIVGIDHGYRAHAAWIYGAVSPDGEVYVYREFYEQETLIKDIVTTNLSLMSNEKISSAAIDPSVRNRTGMKGESPLDEYLEHLPRTFPLVMANNDVRIGIDRVKSYLKTDARGRPRLFVFDTCVNLIDEFMKYHYDDKQDKRRPDQIVKEEDHAIDALRYMIMQRPDDYIVKLEAARAQPKKNIEKLLEYELSMLKKKKVSDPFGF